MNVIPYALSKDIGSVAAIRTVSHPVDGQHTDISRKRFRLGTQVGLEPTTLRLTVAAPDLVLCCIAT